MSLPRMLDVSSWQGAIDWHEEAREVVAVYVKCTQGQTYVNPKHNEQVAGARGAGLPAGGYHFCVPGVGSGESQADRLLRYCPRRAGVSLRPCLDCEDNSQHLNGAQLAAWYLGAVTRLHARLGYWPVIYGSPSYLEQFATFHPEVFGRCPLWLADYGVKVPKVPAPWSHWQAWQWTSGYRDPATSGLVDDSFVAELRVLRVPGDRILRTLVGGGGSARVA